MDAFDDDMDFNSEQVIIIYMRSAEDNCIVTIFAMHIWTIYHHKQPLALLIELNKCGNIYEFDNFILLI